MKRIVVVSAFSLAVSCGGSNGGGKNLSNFLGAPWNGSITTNVPSCSGIPAQTETDQVAVTFLPGSGADLQFTLGTGCTFLFNVSGNTASLANTPTCTITLNGFTVSATWTTFTATTTDGHYLSMSASGSGTAQGFPVSCPFTQAGTATR
jgi:hypothetical protein